MATDDATIFDEAIRHFGLGSRMNRLPRDGDAWKGCYGRIEEWANELISSARSLNPTLPEIHFDFVLNGDVNAYAFRREGRYFIGLTTGTRYMFDLVFGRMLADAGVLPFIGDPSQESKQLPPLTGYVPNGESMYQAGTVLCGPRNPPRISYAIHLTSQALLFLIGHEIAHISRGHVDYQASKTGSAFLAEASDYNLAGDEAFERQTLEMDADTKSIVSRMFSAKLNFQAGVVPPWLNEPRTPGHFMFDALFSTSCFFRLFGDQRFTCDNLTRDLYPPLPVRQGIAAATAMFFVQTEWDQSLKDTAAQASRLAITATEHSYAAILGDELPREGLSEASSDVGKQHWLNLLKHWDAEVKEKLSPFAYEPL